jgi:phosphoribosylformylglycinamidine synthase
MVTRLEIAVRPGLRDPRGEEAEHRIRSFLGIPVEHVRTREVYRIEAELTPDESRRVLDEFIDPVQQVGALGRLAEEAAYDVIVGVGYKPGVTDPVGKSAKVAVEDTLGRPLGANSAVYCSRLYLLQGVDTEQAQRIAGDLLANPVIQTIEVAAWREWSASEPDLGVPRVPAGDVPAVERIDLSGDDGELERISREGLLALNLSEMRAIRDHFAEAAGSKRRKASGLDSRPTDVELECLAQTWSEHCKHKIFNATITYREPGKPDERIESLFKTCIRGATKSIDECTRRRNGASWLVSVFHDNAGVVTFDDTMHLVYKVETHNSPSALDPYGGAITGIVGVNRDPFGTGLGSDLLANVWGYCFASPFHDTELPTGLLHPRRIRDGVHQGVIDGGNQSGVPYGRGWERFDARYLGKPLVFCGTVGALPVTVAGQPGEEKCARPGDRIVMVGGRIGADGIHGATFSSAMLDESAPVQAVQIGDPITQKRMFDFLLEARQEGLYSAITDNGAGGLSSSVGEMAEGSGGARLDLSRAPLKYQGLAPWEILVSEAQERMTLAIPPNKLGRFLEAARLREVEATDLGTFTDDGFFEVTYGDEAVALLRMEFLHEGDPDLELTATWVPPRFDEPAERVVDLQAALPALLGRLNLCSGENKARHYDHEVKGLSVIKPFIGVDQDVPADATVSLARHGSLRGFVLSEGINPFLSDLDTRAMAMTVVDEALRRQLCAGARLDRIAMLDNFCWPDPVRSERTPDGEYKLAQLVRACRGLRDAVVAYRTPLISGKDSMKNDSTMGGVKISVPPTLLVSAIGQIDDVRRSRTLESKAAGDLVYLIGSTADELGGSEYYRFLGEADGLEPTPGAAQPYVGRRPPAVDPDRLLPLYRAFEKAGAAGLLRSASTPSLGGWGPLLARCVMASGLGLDLDLSTACARAGLSPERFLFSESNGRFLVTVRPTDRGDFEDLFDGLPLIRIGTVSAQPRLEIAIADRAFAWESGDLSRAFKETLADD